MSSQSGDQEDEIAQEYRDAWATMSMLTEKGNLSWSGRESNRVFLNLGGAEFADVSSLTGADWIDDSRACARLDWDEDGRQDLVLRNRTAPRLRLMLNRWPRPGNWLQCDLRGTACNRDAVGAQVFAETAGRTLRGSVRAGEGFLAVSSKRVHLGLGDATEARVRVRWPGGVEEDFGVLAAGRRWSLVQGAGTAAPVERRPAAALLAAAPRESRPTDAAIVRVPLIQALPLDPLPLPAWDAPQRTFADLAGAPTLVNFWSATCSACVEEFEVLRKRQAQLKALRLNVVPMLVGGETGANEARALLASYGLANGAGAMDERSTALLGPILQDVLLDSEDMPLPSSLLLDAQGRLRAIYLGSFRFRELAQDVQAVGRLPLDALQEQELCGGSVLIAHLRDFDRLARRYTELGHPAAAELYRERYQFLQKLMGR